MHPLHGKERYNKVICCLRGFFSCARYFSFTCLFGMSVSLIIVVFFGVSYSFALLSSASARLVLTLLSCIARGHQHASNSAVTRILSATASLFLFDFDLATYASWSAGTPRLRHVSDRSQCLVEPSCSRPLLVPFPRVLLVTVHREYSVSGLVLLIFLVFFQHLSGSSAPASARSLGFPTISSMCCT